MDCCIDNLLVTEVSVPIPEIICFSKGSPKGISCASKDSIGFPKEIFGSPKGVICVSKDSIGFPKEIFGSPKGVSQIRIRVRQIMYAAQIAPSWPPNEVKHLGSALVFLVEILSRPSNNSEKSFLENTVHIA